MPSAGAGGVRATPVRALPRASRPPEGCRVVRAGGGGGGGGGDGRAVLLTVGGGPFGRPDSPSRHLGFVRRYPADAGRSCGCPRRRARRPLCSSHFTGLLYLFKASWKRTGRLRNQLCACNCLSSCMRPKWIMAAAGLYAYDQGFRPRSVYSGAPSLLRPKRPHGKKTREMTLLSTSSTPPPPSLSGRGSANTWPTLASLRKARTAFHA